MRVYDISPLISSRLGVFPGDQKFERHVVMSFPAGHHLELSRITSTLHLGAHADSPGHYSAEGGGIHAVDVRRYLGPCMVVDALHARGRRVGWQDLDDEAREMLTSPTPRVLVRTLSFPDPENWNSDFASFEPEFLEDLASSGVQLVGIDTPSVDPETSKDLPAHAMLARYQMSVLEGLMLGSVVQGTYVLVAAPLKIEGADSGPCRALLLESEIWTMDNLGEIKEVVKPS
jgi:arylformamidase